MTKIFAAIPLPEAITASLEVLQVGIVGASWTPAENFHLTLAYLGEVSSDVLHDVDAMLTGIRRQRFDLALCGAGNFGSKAGRSVWVGVDYCPGLFALQENVELACRQAGARPETRRFSPHVTIGYVRRASETDVANWVVANNLFRSRSFSVDAFGLHESRRTAAGNVYPTLASYPLSSSR